MIHLGHPASTANPFEVVLSDDSVEEVEHADGRKR